MAFSSTKPRSDADGQVDQRPRFGIGHVMLPAVDVGRMADFYTSAGMRLVVNMGRMAILELRGGTHIVINQGAPGGSVLDLIVDDIDETRRVLDAAGAAPTIIVRGNPHDRFTATDPEGNTLVINSDHSIGVV